MNLLEGSQQAGTRSASFDTDRMTFIDTPGWVQFTLRAVWENMHMSTIFVGNSGEFCLFLYPNSCGNS